MKRIITYNISEKYQDKKIEYFLKDMQYPHAVIVQLKKTENGIMLNNAFGGNPITYQKKPTEKKYIDTKDLYKADLLSFDSKIGYITNCSTTLYSMLSLFEKDSVEYNTIMHRLKECRVAQGNEID